MCRPRNLYSRKVGGVSSYSHVTLLHRFFVCDIQVHLTSNSEISFLQYFEQDDPDLYLSKAKYILDHDVEEMELYFVEEEYDKFGQLLKVSEELHQ